MFSTIDGRRRGISSATTSVAACAVALVVLAWALAVSPAFAADPLPGLQGGSLGDGDLARGTTVIVVWASWSPKCRDIVPRVNDLVGRLGGRARVATVNFQEDRATVEKFLAGQSLSAPVYLDARGEFSKAHAVTTLPGLVVYRDGQVRYQGRLDGDAFEQVDKLLQ